MIKNIRNVFCVGRNYVMHAAELGNPIPDEPLIFSKPTHAITYMTGETVQLPGTLGEVHYEGELVLHIGKEYKPGMQVDGIVDAFTLGIDFTLRDVQSDLKKKGQPWLKAKGFRNSGLVAPFQAFPGVEKITEISFSLVQNGIVKQEGTASEMLFNLQTIIDYLGQYYGLAEGDIIYTGTPAGVGPVQDGDKLALNWGSDELASSTITMN
ncbi:fumarylacetoacetate hydrolase family protein [Paenibacillus sp. N1-5-1-14]|uniref:fumarylacetoacetate hydrolase family protein n=1 Tax=Paenibacillus radicibacter TaxID=2972488 RepID=UPI002158D826|nr:fumarylacetoacetate hydrolase family protein [Paenibacillus radicibacter]MCR8643867.1 fumarylacetoacetate hydrolase family protein [Paenibacillus radicibacter]